MATKSEQERSRADARFAKAQKQVGEAAQAQAMRDAKVKSDNEKTLRLRALRLAKEADEAAAKPVKAVPAPRAVKAEAAAKPAKAAPAAKKKAG